MSARTVNLSRTAISSAAWWIKDAVDSGLTRLTWLGLSRLTEKRALALSHRLTPFFAFSVGRKPHINSRRFFGPLGWSNAEFQRFHSARHDYLARIAVDCSRLCVLSPAQLVERTTFAGLEHIEAALTAGHGLLLLGGHMGSFPLLSSVLSSRGYKTAAAFRPVARGVDQRFAVRLANRFGSTLEFTGKNALALMRQMFGRNQCFLTFFDVMENINSTLCLPFGHVQMRIALGPPLLVVRSRVPVAYVSTRQIQGCRNLVTITPVNCPPNGRSINDVIHLSARLLQLLYQDVLASPVQWWMWGFQDLTSNDGGNDPREPALPSVSSRAETEIRTS